MSKEGSSLKRQLLLWLLIPQLLIWVVGAMLSNAVAIHHANTAIDNDLIQLANTLLHQASSHSTQGTQELSKSTKALLTSNPDDRIYYSVGRPEQPPLLSNITQAPDCGKKGIAGVPDYCAGMIAQQPVRILNILLPELDQPQLFLQIRVAKNLVLRRKLAREILMATVLPLSLLIITTSFLAWWGINRGLKPLDQLQQAVKDRAVQDITPIQIDNAPREIHALTDELNAFLSEMNESIEKQRRFIADAAHQLRTPLAGLKSQTELAMRETNIKNLQARLQLVHTSSIRSIHLINQLLTLARSEPGQQDIMPKVNVDLARLIREITAEAVPRALAANIDLGCNSSLIAANINANSALLRELFLNLIENAIKYTPSGSTVTLRLLSEEEHYVVEIEDNGPGIPDIDKARVFERFYRGTQLGNGCGLGLAIVKEIVLRHNGDIEIHDANPHGLIVRIRFPKPVETESIYQEK